MLVSTWGRRKVKIAIITEAGELIDVRAA